MKPITKILIVVLSITALVPLKLAILCLFSQADALEFFNMEKTSPDIEKLLIILGGLVLAMLVLHVMTITWLLKRKTEGFALSYLSGGINLGRGLLMMFLFNANGISDTRLYAAPGVIGAVIILLTIFAKKAS